MIKFEDQLKFYINRLIRLSMMFGRFLKDEDSVRLGNLEKRMKRELLRTYNKGKNI